MKIRVQTLLLAALCAGCAPMPMGGPGQSLAMRALNEAATFSYAVKSFLASGRSESDAIEAAKVAIQSKLKDPGSAQFRNVQLKPYLEGAVICGEVNAKNSYGGYVGFKRFFASTDVGTIEDTDPRYPQISQAYNAGIDNACR